MNRGKKHNKPTKEEKKRRIEKIVIMISQNPGLPTSYIIQKIMKQYGLTQRSSYYYYKEALEYLEKPIENKELVIEKNKILKFVKGRIQYLLKQTINKPGLETVIIGYIKILIDMLNLKSEILRIEFANNLDYLKNKSDAELLGLLKKIEGKKDD